MEMTTGCRGGFILHVLGPVPRRPSFSAYHAMTTSEKQLWEKVSVDNRTCSASPRALPSDLRMKKLLVVIIPAWVVASCVIPTRDSSADAIFSDLPTVSAAADT